MIIRRLVSTVVPSLWEHPFRGSPRPAETLVSAVRRCVERDLGIHVMAIGPLLPTLTNDTSSATGILEVHPSYLVTSQEQPRIVDGFEAQWLDPEKLGAHARRNSENFSPLLALHAAHLPFFGGVAYPVNHVALHQNRATG